VTVITPRRPPTKNVSTPHMLSRSLFLQQPEPFPTSFFLPAASPPPRFFLPSPLSWHSRRALIVSSRVRHFFFWLELFLSPLSPLDLWMALFVFFRGLRCIFFVSSQISAVFPPSMDSYRSGSPFSSGNNLERAASFLVVHGRAPFPCRLHLSLHFSFLLLPPFFSSVVVFLSLSP